MSSFSFAAFFQIVLQSDIPIYTTGKNTHFFPFTLPPTITILKGFIYVGYRKCWLITILLSNILCMMKLSNVLLLYLPFESCPLWTASS